jgi:hypothetical protein
MNLDTNFETEVEGYFTLTKWKVDKDGVEVPGSRHEPVPTFRNLITNGGLDRMGNNTDYLYYCQIGSGGATPVNADTSLANWLASFLTFASTLKNPPEPPYYASITKDFQFPVGAAAGNISEIGIGWTDKGNLFSRALVKDSAGNPTTITVLPDEILQVTYQLRFYPPLVDNSGTVTLAGVPYNWVSRASGVTISTYWQAGVAQGVGNGVFNESYSGSIGADIVAVPSGEHASISQGGSQSDAVYNPGTYSRTCTLTFGLDAANYPGGIGAIRFIHGSGCYQFGFTPKIPKKNTNTLALSFTHTWARKAL